MGIRSVPQAFAIELLFPPMNYDQRKLKEFYLDISDRFNYPQFELLESGNGATFSDKKGRQTLFLPDRWKIEDKNTVLTYSEWSEQTIEFLSGATLHFKMPVFITQSITSNLLIPIEMGTMGAAFLHKHFLKLNNEQLSSFERPLSGIGLRFVFPPTEKNKNEIQLRLEPYFRDRSMLYLEIIFRSFFPCTDTTQLKSIFDESYRFLDEKFESFFTSLSDTDKG